MRPAARAFAKAASARSERSRSCSAFTFLLGAFTFLLGAFALGGNEQPTTVEEAEVESGDLEILATGPSDGGIEGLAPHASVAIRERWDVGVFLEILFPEAVLVGRVTEVF